MMLAGENSRVIAHRVDQRLSAPPTPAPARAARGAARVGSAGAADRLRADLISALGVPAEQVVVGRWQEAPDAGSVEIRVRVAGTRAVRLVDRWAVAITGPEGLVPVAVGG
ncbi:MAG: hypothetical protein ACO3VG_06390 [Nitriliruptoraceae bacterium]